MRPAAPADAAYDAGPAPGSTVAVAGQAQRFDEKMQVAADWWRLFRCSRLILD